MTGNGHPIELDCGTLQRTRWARTFACREVFSPTRMSPEKTDLNDFAPAGAKLCEAIKKTHAVGVSLFTLFIFVQNADLNFQHTAVLHLGDGDVQTL